MSRRQCTRDRMSSWHKLVREMNSYIKYLLMDSLLEILKEERVSWKSNSNSILGRPSLIRSLKLNTKMNWRMGMTNRMMINLFLTIEAVQKVETVMLLILMHPWIQLVEPDQVIHQMKVHILSKMEWKSAETT